MRTFLKIVFALIVVVVLLAVGAYAWATITTNGKLDRVVDTHRVDFPIPFPLDAAELAASGSSEAAAQQLANERAVERGRHLVSSRYACAGCHGANLGGGVMVDAFPIGTLLGPNLTTGKGSRTLEYGPADWDRIVRHGVKPDGHPAVMPSIDFVRMSDQELSDIVSYIRSLPPVDNTVPAPSFGPLGRVLFATGEIEASAFLIAAHHEAHRVKPPPTEATVEFGQHLAAVCTGCHRPDLSGGPIKGGDPSWPPASNLTPHLDALGSWTQEQFVRALREGVRPDGTPLRPPMSEMPEFAKRMADVELTALWMYVRSLPPVAPADR
jgi:mono/diheme cytochrome c family protein